MNTSEKLIRKISEFGYPAEFGKQIAMQLRTEKAMTRMLGYLNRVKHVSMEEIADEMLAVCADRDAWVSRKKAEYYSAEYNTYLFEKKK